jgi:serine/threonine-protein kinase
MPDKKTYICPICNLQTNDEYCPKDRCPTVDARFLQKKKDPLIGIILKGQYKIIDLVGRGGMGKVYKGFQMTVNREVAIKVLLMDPDEESAEKLGTVKRFHREAMAASQLKHPNTIKIIDYGQTEDGLLFMVMEFLHGQTLRQVIRKNKGIGLERSVHIVTQICKSLAEAHANGIVHRDLKPDNIILTDVFGEEDFVKVLDFGISKVLTKGSGDSSLTKSGVIIGTPEYLAPEQAQGSDRISPATDMYSLGVILYEMLSGNQPFVSNTPMGILMKHINEEPPPLEMKGFSDTIRAEADKIIRKLLAKRPEERFQSALELSSELKKLLTLPVLTRKEDALIIENTLQIKKKTTENPEQIIQPTEVINVRVPENKQLQKPKESVARKQDHVVKQILKKESEQPANFLSNSLPAKAVFTPMTMEKVRSKGKSDRFIWYAGIAIFIMGIAGAVLIYAIRSSENKTFPEGEASPGNVEHVTLESKAQQEKPEQIASAEPEKMILPAEKGEKEQPSSSDIPINKEDAIKKIDNVHEKENMKIASKVTVKVETEPEGASIYAGNELKGRSPLTINTDYGKEITISAKQKGFFTQVEKFVANEDRDIHFKLISMEKKKIDNQTVEKEKKKMKMPYEVKKSIEIIEKKEPEPSKPEIPVF